MLDIKCIITIVERGKADKIVEHAKKAGASGATIMYGRGTGEHEIKRFLNINIDSSKEIIIILTETEKYKQIKEAIIKAGRIKEAGTGIIFTVPVTDLIGLHHRGEFDI